ncbi:ABC transporter permease [Modestobacter roseus]|uniref:Xylose transport system permease protein XylH n=1 Tax=Modestobacter roseus TaxID=1181884 RepID=A0A562IUZ9_9ACTN|nr:ABC transporter permease [Modestobacter roseus]TWH74593.1 monosaccharide ABC transporter membrane protein (CUT2 family) [Modestobacter roseus]
MTPDRPLAFGPPAPVVPRSRGRRMFDRLLARPGVSALIGVAVLTLLFGAQSPDLLSSAGLASVLEVAAPLGIGAVAVALLLVAGQFDLSIGVVAVSSALLTALLVTELGLDLWPALLLSLLAALLVGAVNGLLVVSTGLPSFLVTLATFLILSGAAQAVAAAVADAPRVGGLRGEPGWDSAHALFGSMAQIGDGRFPVSVLWWGAATVVTTWLLWRTRFGNAVFASGGAPRPARELGVPVGRTTVLLFLGTAAAGWLIGTLGVARLGAVQVTPALGAEIQFVVVAVIGGCLLTGGYGSTVGASLGALLYAVAHEGIALSDWDPRWFEAFLGALLLVALLVNGVVRRRLRAVPRS